MTRTFAGALHEKVRREIIRRVIANEYRTEEPLPSAAELAEEFGVSGITVKRALRDLQSIGILRAVPGLGTFVRETRRLIRDICFSLTSLEESHLEFKPLIQLNSITRERIQNPAFSEFGPPTGTMLCVRKTVSSGGTPIIFDTSYLPLGSKNALIDEPGANSASEALRGQETRFRKIRMLIEAAPASEDAQKAFAIPIGYPTLRRFYHLTTCDASISVFGVAESPFDRLACTVELNML